MRIKELKLHNFRGIKDLHLVFDTSRSVVVLVGINGVGKSSILNCVNFLIEYYLMICENDNTFDGELYDYEKLLSDSDINIESNFTFNTIKVNFDESWDVEWKIAKFGKHDTNKDWDKIHQKSRENIVNNSETNLCNHYFYYQANRQVTSSNIFTVTKVDDIINFEDFSEWFKQTEDLENEKRLSDNIEYRHPVLTSVRRAVYSLLGKSYRGLTFKRAIARMTIKKSNREINIELLSDGEKSLLAMVGHLSRKLAEDYSDLDNPLEASALVLIDEIELHLHPEWQRMIIPRLTKTFPNCQFIVTTHSPQVLSHVDPECIHILDYDGDNVIVKRPESSYGLDSNRILEDILGVSKRPQEIQDRMLELFRTINNNDLESAKEIVQELGDRIGINEPELIKAEATIKRREIIGR
jgi:predicted ATP-binding protein involved in virulence